MGDSVLNTTNTNMNKEEAIIKVLKVLKNAMLVVNKHNRDEVLTLAEEYDITVAELITAWSDMAMRI